jgi:hypothetical protein
MMSALTGLRFGGLMGFACHPRRELDLGGMIGIS